MKRLAPIRIGRVDRRINPMVSHSISKHIRHVLQERLAHIGGTMSDIVYGIMVKRLRK